LFRHQIAEPLSGGLDVGMPVVSSSGRALGTVSGVVVKIGSGRTSYAVAPDEPREGHVLLLPRESVREDRQTAVIEEDVLQDLRRRTA
jgi:sporulation protein YlmC with PRC-barrel domain